MSKPRERRSNSAAVTTSTNSRNTNTNASRGLALPLHRTQPDLGSSNPFQRTASMQSEDSKSISDEEEDSRLLYDRKYDTKLKKDQKQFEIFSILRYARLQLLIKFVPSLRRNFWWLGIILCMLSTMRFVFQYNIRNQVARWKSSKMSAVSKKLAWVHLHDRLPQPMVVELVLPPITYNTDQSEWGDIISYTKIIQRQNDRRYGYNLMTRKSPILEVIDQKLQSSNDYSKNKDEDFITDECEQQHDWQLSNLQTCNSIHEIYFHHNLDETNLINNGYWRDVWKIKQTDGSNQVMKTLRYPHDYTNRNYNRHRKDALASERLSSSPRVMDIYGFCGQTGIFEYTELGDLGNIVYKRKWKEIKSVEKLKIALEITKSLADVHSVDGKVASIAHTDVAPGQFLNVNGTWKINDFNRSRFMRFHKNSTDICGYHVNNNPGTWRSPEEYFYLEQDEMVDVYSLGNVYYAMLTRKYPFQGEKPKKAIQKVKDGKRAPLPDDVANSNDKSIIALIKAMELSQAQNSNERPSATELVQLLVDALHEITK